MIFFSTSFLRIVPISVLYALLRAVRRIFSTPLSVAMLTIRLRVGGAFDGLRVATIRAVLRRIPRGYVLVPRRRPPLKPGPHGMASGFGGCVIWLTRTDLSEPLKAGSLPSLIIVILSPGEANSAFVRGILLILKTDIISYGEPV